MKLIYIDTETTGLDPKKGAIIQLSGIIRTEDGIATSFDYRMAPFGNSEISNEALEIQRRTLEEVRAYPDQKKAYHEFVELLGRFCNKYDKQDKYFMFGYNVQFDAEFLRVWFDRNDDKYYGSWFWNPPIDVMSLAAMALMQERSSLPNFKLGTVAEHLLGPAPEGLHDAMADVHLTRRILLKLKEQRKPIPEVAYAE
jgi:DNA polymerase-3 subunit epsilon